MSEMSDTMPYKVMTQERKAEMKKFVGEANYRNEKSIIDVLKRVDVFNFSTTVFLVPTTETEKSITYIDKQGAKVTPMLAPGELTAEMVATACAAATSPSHAKYSVLDHITCRPRMVEIGGLVSGNTRIYCAAMNEKRKAVGKARNPTGGISSNHCMEDRAGQLLNVAFGGCLHRLMQGRSKDFVVAMPETTTDDDVVIASVQASTTRFLTAKGQAQSSKTLATIVTVLFEGHIYINVVLVGEPDTCRIVGAHILFPGDLPALLDATKGVSDDTKFGPSPFALNKPRDGSLAAAMSKYMFWVDDESDRPTLARHFSIRLVADAALFPKNKTMRYYNEDESQMGKNHWIEQRYFNNLRTICDFKYSSTSDQGDIFIDGVLVEGKKCHVCGRGYQCDINPAMYNKDCPVLMVALEKPGEHSYIHIFIALRSVVGGLVINLNNPTLKGFVFFLAKNTNGTYILSQTAVKGSRTKRRAIAACDFCIIETDTNMRSAARLAAGDRILRPFITEAGQRPPLTASALALTKSVPLPAAATANKRKREISENAS